MTDDPTLGRTTSRATEGPTPRPSRKPPGRFSTADLWRWSFCLVICVIVIGLVSPMVVVVLTSFNDRLVTFPPATWTLQAYRDIPQFLLEATWLSAKVGVLATAIAMSLAIPTSLGLARGKLPGRAFFNAFYQIPLQIPAIVQGIALYQFFLLVEPLGIELRASFRGLVIGHVMLIFPFILTTAVGRIMAMDPNLELAANGLGAGFVRTTFRVTLPLMRPALIAGGFLAFLVSFDDTALSLFLTGPSGPTLPLALLFTSEQAMTPALYAMSTLVIIGSFLIAATVDRLFGLRTALGGR